MGLRIWKQLLICNRGISYDFILGRLPRAKDDIFFDASTTWGIGGCSGTLYFAIPWCEIDDSFKHDIIVRKELLAALVALECFSPVTKGKLAMALTDNSNCVQRGLKSDLGWGGPDFMYFSYKYKHRSKVIEKFLHTEKCYGEIRMGYNSKSIKIFTFVFWEK